MAHEIAKTQAGTDAFAFVGDRSQIWHGLGQQLQVGAPLETWREAAGMNFTVGRSRVRFPTAPDQAPELWATMDDKHVLYRSDTKAPLGIVSPDYNIVQPGETLEFFRDFVSDMGFTMETAGVLFGGRRFFALAKVGNSFTLAGQDKVGGYLLLSTSCDGTLATSGQFTSVRVVCNNTLRMALGAKNHGAIKVYHSSEFDHAAMKSKLGVGAEQWDEFHKNAAALAIKKISKAGAEDFLSKFFGEISTKKENIQNMAGYQKVFGLFNGEGMGSELASAQGTAWGLLNGVTEWVDHWKRASTADHRIAAALWGEGDDIKVKAAQMLLAV